MRSTLRIFCRFGLDHPGKHTGDLSRSMHFCFAERSTLQWRLLKALPQCQVHISMLTAQNPCQP
jgi:hypothetical protein